jgi:hypothetical protein
VRVCVRVCVCVCVRACGWGGWGARENTDVSSRTYGTGAAIPRHHRLCWRGACRVQVGGRTERLCQPGLHVPPRPALPPARLWRHVACPGRPTCASIPPLAASRCRAALAAVLSAAVGPTPLAPGVAVASATLAWSWSVCRLVSRIRRPPEGEPDVDGARASASSANSPRSRRSRGSWSRPDPDEAIAVPAKLLGLRRSCGAAGWGEPWQAAAAAGPGSAVGTGAACGQRANHANVECRIPSTEPNRTK